MSSQEEINQLPSEEKIEVVQKKTEAAKNMVIVLIQKALKRNQPLIHLEESSQTLAESSQEFRRSAVRLRRKNQWKNLKLWLILLIVCLTVVFVLIVVVVLGALAGTHRI